MCAFMPSRSCCTMIRRRFFAPANATCQALVGRRPACTSSQALMNRWAKIASKRTMRWPFSKRPSTMPLRTASVTRRYMAANQPMRSLVAIARSMISSSRSITASMSSRSNSVPSASGMPKPPTPSRGLTPNPQPRLEGLPETLKGSDPAGGGNHWKMANSTAESLNQSDPVEVRALVEGRTNLQGV